ncbi:hypothetical protein NC651_028628 [Populus alba x Populus x berolinensis]|nr:hypothetical protein NC651_028628 [Populus alba x Populus x berolinensis]
MKISIMSIRCFGREEGSHRNEGGRVMDPQTFATVAETLVKQGRKEAFGYIQELGKVSSAHKIGNKEKET